LIDETRKANLEKAATELVDFDTDTCPICGSKEYTPAGKENSAHCTPCEKDTAEYLKSVNFREVKCCGNCKKWEDHLYAGFSQEDMHCKLAQDRGVNWSHVAVYGYCEGHTPTKNTNGGE